MTSNVTVKARTSPVIGIDKTIYVGGSDNKLYAINPNGSIKWSLALTGGRIRTPAISSTGGIYVADGYSLYSIHPNGSIEWDTKTFTQEPWFPQTGPPYITFTSDITIYNDIIYFGETVGRFGAITLGGSMKWHAKDDRYQGPTIYVAPTIGFDRLFIKDVEGMFGSYSLGIGNLWFYWWYPGYTGDMTLYPLPIGADGYLYVNLFGFLSPVDYQNGLTTGHLPSYDHSGGIGISSDGTVYVGSTTGYFYAFKNNSGVLAIKWAFPADGAIMSSPAIGSDGTVYFGTDNGKVYAVDKNGSKKWEYSTGGAVMTALAIGPDGTLYAGSSDGKIYGFHD